MSRKKEAVGKVLQLVFLVMLIMVCAVSSFFFPLSDAAGAPTAVLSAPAEVTYGSSFMLDGTGSYAEVPAHLDRYEWTYLGPASSASFGGGFSTAAVFVRDMPIYTDGPTIEVTISPGSELPVGSHRFRLVVTDDMGVESTPDIKEVIVRDPNAPVAVLSVPAEVVYGSSFMLDGSGSYAAAPARIARYVWTYLGPAASASFGGGFSTAATFTLNTPIETTDPSIEVTITPGSELPVGRHRFRLVVRDDMGISSPSDIEEVLVSDAMTTVPVTTTTSITPDTTTVPYTTTTTTTRKLCPALFLAGSEQETIHLLYGFRDRVLFNSPQGRRYIMLFYRHAEETAAILIKNPDIAARSRSVLNMLLPQVKAMLDGIREAVMRDESSAVAEVLDMIAAEAGPELKASLAELQKDLRQETLFKGTAR
jgi:hypothetical protein